MNGSRAFGYSRMRESNLFTCYRCYHKSRRLAVNDLWRQDVFSPRVRVISHRKDLRVSERIAGHADLCILDFRSRFVNNNSALIRTDKYICCNVTIECVCVYDGCVSASEKTYVKERTIRRNCIIYRDSINARLATGRCNLYIKEPLMIASSSQRRISSMQHDENK